MTDPLRPVHPPLPGAAPLAGPPAIVAAPIPPAPDPTADEAVADFMGGALLADPGAAAWGDPAFVDWLAAESRAADRGARRQGDAAFLARGDALLARAQARALGVLRFVAPPEPAERPGRRPGAPGRVREQPAGAAPGMTPDARSAPVIDLGVAAGPGRDLWDEPPERWVRVPDPVPDGRYLALRVVGTSMTPLLRSGDVVLVRTDPRGREVRPGRVVVARHPDDGYVCKRVVASGPAGLVLASLEPGHGPLRLPPDPSLVVGTVVGAWAGR